MCHRQVYSEMAELIMGDIGLTELAFNSTEQLYAYSFKPNPEYPTSDGWTIYDPLKEYKRMGVGTRSDSWRFTYINRSYTFSPTYPHVLVVPKKISDNVLNYAAKYRSKMRIPVLSYLHWQNHATITRSSQPMTGLKGARSIQDEKLIEAIFASNVPTGPNGQIIYGSTAANLIVDARPTANAMGQAVMGAGSENTENYKNCKKAYMGIENIHVMRASLGAMCDAMQGAESTGGAINKVGLAKSGWLKHIAALLEGSLAIIKNIHVFNSHVLVHCSDGWDRTGQLTSIAELCLDPYYRTLRGFEVLIEKDWVSFGHKFADRCGHLSSEKYFVNSFASNSPAAATLKDNLRNVYKSQAHVRETSPVFHQFLDCVYQLLRQHPTRFEFNEKLLVELHYHVYSCQFGTFLFNCERERHVQSPQDSTCSVWDYVNSKRKEFLSDRYAPEKDRDMSSDQGVLLPDARNVRYWAELFGKKDEELNEVVVVTVNETVGTGADVEVKEAVIVQTGDPLGGTSGMMVAEDNVDVMGGTGVTVMAADVVSSPLGIAGDGGWESQSLQATPGMSDVLATSGTPSPVASKPSTPLKAFASFLSSSAMSSSTPPTPPILPPSEPSTPSSPYAAGYDVEDPWREDKELVGITPTTNNFQTSPSMSPSSSSIATPRSNPLQDFSSTLASLAPSRATGASLGTTLVGSFTRFTMNMGEVVYGRGRAVSLQVDSATNGRGKMGDVAGSPLGSPGDKIRELATMNAEMSGAGATTTIASTPTGFGPLSSSQRVMRSASASSDASSSPPTPSPRSTFGGLDFPFPIAGLLKRNGSVTSLSQQIQQAQESRMPASSSPFTSPPRSNSINSISSTASLIVAPLSSQSPSSSLPLGGDMVSSFTSRPASFKSVSLSTSPATFVPVLASPPLSARERMVETKATDIPDPTVVKKELPHPLWVE
ncbi:protein-tyrosine phosphatase-like protein [Jimgerdemannia flammicorona]|uniref:Protein-tyrosine phosphatase-like protein n=1 Tax=Jimgerdemannia flammicorona TaxID=994334 RepID=A0A433A357_9FUNG|nr:protein-tyrosine phosphatase-like protein [Jimgerdemannia flammicorona]